MLSDATLPLLLSFSADAFDTARRFFAIALRRRRCCYAPAATLAYATQLPLPHELL